MDLQIWTWTYQDSDSTVFYSSHIQSESEQSVLRQGPGTPQSSNAQTRAELYNYYTSQFYLDPQVYNIKQQNNLEYDRNYKLWAFSLSTR